jgi:hypothetical protein
LILELLASLPDLLFDPKLTFWVQRLHCLKSLVRSFRKELHFVEESRVEFRLLGQASSCWVNRWRHLLMTSDSTVLARGGRIVQQLAKVNRCRRTDWGAWEAVKGGRDVGVAVVQVRDVLNLGVLFFQQSQVVGVVRVGAVKVVVSNDVSKDAW